MFLKQNYGRGYLGQVPNVVRIQKQLLQTSGIPQDVLRDRRQGAVSLINNLHLPVAALEDRNAPEHRAQQSRGAQLMLDGKVLGRVKIAIFHRFLHHILHRNTTNHSRNYNSRMTDTTVICDCYFGAVTFLITATALVSVADIFFSVVKTFKNG